VVEIEIQDEADLFLSMRNLRCKEREEMDHGMDITALDKDSKEKILLRIVESKSKSEFIGIDAVRKMLKAMELEDYDKGVIFGRKFTVAAKQQLMENNIQRISEGHMQNLEPEKLYLLVNTYVDDLCKTKCGKIPKKESDCKGDCKIRVISDDASFHFEQGWIRLMKNDLKQLLAIRNSNKSD
jgi:hypothetical protein